MDREEFFGLLKFKFPTAELGLVQDAYCFAKDMHRRQLRDNGERHFEHCRRAALTLIRDRKIFDAKIISAALLHDIIEDTFAHPRMLVKLFGEEMYDWISMLSKNIPQIDDATGKILLRQKKNLQDYFFAIQSGPVQVQIVKLSDRLDNLRSFGVWPLERRERYVRETREYVFPIAQAADPWFLGEFSKFCSAISP